MLTNLVGICDNLQETKVRIKVNLRESILILYIFCGVNILSNVFC